MSYSLISDKTIDLNLKQAASTSHTAGRINYLSNFAVEFWREIIM